jgi:hypothetical protein
MVELREGEGDGVFITTRDGRRYLISSCLRLLRGGFGRFSYKSRTSSARKADGVARILRLTLALRCAIERRWTGFKLGSAQSAIALQPKWSERGNVGVPAMGWEQPSKAVSLPVV